MVQLNSSFDADGPPFSGWRVGWGFGKRCRSYMCDPSQVVTGRDTPKGSGYYRENRFWKGKWEMDQINTMGVGPRPDYGRQGSHGVAPHDYGDVSKKLSAIKEDLIFKNIKLKPRFLSIDQKIAQNPRNSGPGPAKYDTRFRAGDAGLSRGSRNPKWSIGGRHADNHKLNEEEGKPGPGHYVTRGKPGKNYPTTHGTLYDITLGQKLAAANIHRGPGPGHYRQKGMFDQY